MNFKSLYNLFRSHPEGNWIVKPYNAETLYNLIKSNPVKKILDLGTGIGLSASTIALAMEEKKEPDYEIHTVEQKEKCHRLAQELVPEELKKNIKFYLSKFTIWQTDKIPYQYFSTYESLPENDYDFILVDGPGPEPIDGNFIDLPPNGDIIKLLLEDKIKPKTLVFFDGRIQSIRIVERYFSDNFYLILSDPDYNVLERKDNPVNLNDSKLEMMSKVFPHYLK